MITIEQLIDIVREASALMVTDGFEIEQKGGCENIVTTSDLAVQNFLCGKLYESMPESGFLCEEKDINDVTHEYTWIIDPIDGTANYSRGIDQCAICVGLKHGDDMVMGVVYLPRTNELFHAEKGKGAYLNGIRIHVSSRTFDNAVLCTALPVYHKEYADVCSRIILETFGKCNDIRRFGACAPELCYLAMGRCELYFEYMLSPWDYAAASLIVTEAGGIISSADGNRLCLTAPVGVIAANNESNYRQLLAIVKEKTSHLLLRPES
ncbi:MAG: inositol monophosphatase family protein [Prevotella sp.]